MGIDQLQQLVILLVLFCVDFKYGAMITYQLGPAKIFSSETSIFIVIIDGWLTDFVICIIWHISLVTKGNYGVM